LKKKRGKKQKKKNKKKKKKKKKNNNNKKNNKTRYVSMFSHEQKKHTLPLLQIDWLHYLIPLTFQQHPEASLFFHRQAEIRHIKEKKKISLRKKGTQYH
jgi:hypothetical protein